MSDERALEAIQLSQPDQADSPQVSTDYYEPHQLGELSKLGRLYVLADGVSGVSSGYTVSQYAVGKVLHSYFTTDTTDPKERLLEAIRQANTDIFERNQEYPERRVMSTTLIAALIQNDKLLVANIGDSRVYVVWDQDIELLNHAGATTDETKEIIGSSAAQPLIPAKIEQPDESQAKPAKPTPLRQKYPQGLGLDKEIQIGTFSRRLFAGDTVVLCSGGLTGYVSDQEIAKAVSQHSHAEAIRRLMALAGERGNRDNLAITIARVLSSPVAVHPPGFKSLPLAPKWSDWETPPQPGSRTPTKPSSKPIVSPLAARPDPAAEARLRLTQARFQPIHGRSLARWQGCAIAAVILLLVCAVFVVAWQFFLPPDLVAALPFLGGTETSMSTAEESPQDQNVPPVDDVEPDGSTQGEPGQTPAAAASTSAGSTSPAVEVTLVVDRNSPVSAPEAAFSSPVSTPTGGLANTGDAITVPTPPAETPTPPPLPTIVVPADCTNKARFRRDVTVPDGTQFGPGETFEKMWLLQNAGTCPWGPGYTARHVEGDTMGVAADTPLVDRVSPDTNGEITVVMTAPGLPGSYRGDWQLYDLNGEPFGPEMYLEIEVSPAGPADLEASDLLTLYDFIDRAGEATWSSGDLPYTPLETDISETLPLPGAAGMVAVGPARLRGNVDSDGNVLLTYPHRELGVIEGSYVVDTPLQPTDALAGTLGFIKLSILPDDGVTFEVSFTPTGGTEQVVLSRTVQYQDSPISILQPLAGVAAGQTGTFTLRVVGGERLSQDWAAWIELSLIRQ
jgi:protein phosphatase